MNGGTNFCNILKVVFQILIWEILHKVQVSNECPQADLRHSNRKSIPLYVRVALIVIPIPSCSKIIRLRDI